MAVRNFYWLFEGSLAGSAQPGGVIGRYGSVAPGMTLGQSLDDDLRWLRLQGIGAILSLTEMPLSSIALRAHDFAALHLPIDDETAPRQSDFIDALDFIDVQRIAARGVLVHCRVGEGRTGSILAAYLIRQGATAEQALAHIRAIRPGAVSSPAQQAALVTFASRREWIL